MHLLSARSDSIIIFTDNLPQGSSQCLFLIPKALLPSTIIFLGFLENFDNSNKFNVFLNELCFSWVYFYSKKSSCLFTKKFVADKQKLCAKLFQYFRKIRLKSKWTSFAENLRKLYQQNLSKLQFCPKIFIRIELFLL